MSTSNNATSADNQQERLIKLGWIIGFVDGEGCFSLGVVRQHEKKDKTRIRRGYKLGIQISHEFSVTQGEKSKKSLLDIKNSLESVIYISTKDMTITKNTCLDMLFEREDILNIIIPFLRNMNYKQIKIKILKFLLGVSK